MESPDPKYKHKPSEKHTLEEVLKSLQDLIRNEFDESAAAARTETPDETRAPAGAPPKPAEAKPRREPAPAAREDFAPVSPGSGPVNLDAVMRSLKDLIGNELNVGDEPASPKTKPASTHDEYLSMDDKIEEYIPQGLEGLDDALDLGKEIAPEKNETATPAEQPSSLEEITLEGLLEDLAVPDEELTLESPPEAAPAGAPAEITPEELLNDLAPSGEALSPEPAAEPAPVPGEPEEITPEGLLEDLAPPEESTAPAPVVETESAAPAQPADSAADVVPPPEQRNELSVAEDFTPLDEELTFEQPPEPPPEPAALAEGTDLPGEISPELLEEPALTPPESSPETPSAPTALTEGTDLPGEISPELHEEPASTPSDSPAEIIAAPPPSPIAEEDLAPGTQREMFFEEPPPRAPEQTETDAAPSMTAGAAPAPPPAGVEVPHAEAPPESPAGALPVIDVETITGDKDHPAADTPGETTPPVEASEETIALDEIIHAEPEAMPPAAEAPPAPPVETPAIPESVAPSEPPAAPSAPETASEPARGKSRDEYSVDFDVSDLSPPLPEESGLAPSTEPDHAPAETAETGSAPPTVEFDQSDLTPPQPEEADLAPAEPAAAAGETAGPASTPPAEPEEAPSPTEAGSETPPPAAPPAETAAPSQADDIPVLNEVVAQSGGAAEDKPAASPPGAPLPAPDRAREIVVRAVAKLNVEMRKSGSAGLDTRTILRLQQLIRQELEKGGDK